MKRKYERAETQSSLLKNSKAEHPYGIRLVRSRAASTVDYGHTHAARVYGTVQINQARSESGPLGAEYAVLHAFGHGIFAIACRDGRLSAKLQSGQPIRPQMGFFVCLHALDVHRHGQCGRRSWIGKLCDVSDCGRLFSGTDLSCLLPLVGRIAGECVSYQVGRCSGSCWVSWR